MPRTAGKPLTHMQSRALAGGRHLQPPLLSLFPGDGTVSFKDFLGVLTDSHRLAQCLGEGQGWWGRSGSGQGEALPYLPPCSLPLGKVRNSRVCGPQGLQTLFLEMLFKLMSLGFVPFKSVQEVMRWAQLDPASGPKMGGADSAPAGVPRCPCPRDGSPEFWVSFLGPNLPPRPKWLSVLLWFPHQ